ncbi:MAG: hypothetical protein ABJB66_04310 [Gemmatimonadaceae bacterium]
MVVNRNMGVRVLAITNAALVVLFACAQTVHAQVAPPVPTPLAVAPAAATGDPLVGPTIRKIESAQFVSTEQLGAITGVRPLSDGRVLLNDGTRRRLLLLDSTLKVTSVILDSLTEVQNAYGTRAGALIPYFGDSTLFVDPASLAMLVIDNTGKIARVRSVPRAEDVSWITNSSGSYGLPGFDAQHRLIYRIPARPARPTVAPPTGVPYFPSQPDSAFIVGIHLDTRKVDTIDAVRVQKQVMNVRQNSGGGYDVRSLSAPLPLLDDWTVLPDGGIAFVRGRDYRIDYLNADGSRTSSEKLPFPWVRLTDEDKTRFADSLKTAETRNQENSFTSQMIAWSNVLNKPYPSNFVAARNYTIPQGFPRDWILPTGIKFPAEYTYACPIGTKLAPSAPTPVAKPDSATAKPTCSPNFYGDYYGNGYTPPAPTFRTPFTAAASDLPDYKPPIGASAVRADADGNLWIRTIQMKPNSGGNIYDIVNRAGVLVDRMQLPVGYTLVGFAPGKILYLGTRNATGLHLARVRLR